MSGRFDKNTLLKLPLVLSHVAVMLLIVSLSSGVSFSDAPGSGSSAVGERGSQVFTDYRLGVPQGARSIDGIELQFDASVADTSVGTRLVVELSWDGGQTWTDGHRTPPLSTDRLNYMLGSAIDDWGHRWTPAELNDPARFHVRVRAIGMLDGGSAIHGDVGVRVIYHPAPDEKFHSPTRNP